MDVCWIVWIVCLLSFVYFLVKNEINIKKIEMNIARGRAEIERLEKLRRKER